jgi:hypothetical protein
MNFKLICQVLLDKVKKKMNLNDLIESLGGKEVTISQLILSIMIPFPSLFPTFEIEKKKKKNKQTNLFSL